MISDDFWSEYFKSYDMLLRVIPYRELHELLGEVLALPQGALVLDAGAGTGNCGVILEKRGWRFVGLDYNRVGLRMMVAKNLTATGVAGNLQRPLPFADSSFDGVISCNVLYDIAPKLRHGVARELFRVIKPGGAIALHNVMQGFRAQQILRDHLRRAATANGIARALLDLARFARPTMKLLAMNKTIERVDGGHFFAPGEQSKLLCEAGFIDVTPEAPAYAGGGSVCGARRPRQASL